MNLSARGSNTVVALVLSASLGISTAATADVVRAVQFYHQGFEHYFMTGDAAEIATLDGSVHAGWYRTGKFMRTETAPTPGLFPVCRFYSTIGGKGTHFFTAFTDECAAVKTNPDWIYEGIAFQAALPDSTGVCTPGTGPVVRLYNAGRGGAPNHAYTADALQQEHLKSAGWVSEGVAFCLPVSMEAPLAKTQALERAWMCGTSDFHACFGLSDIRPEGWMRSMLDLLGSPDMPFAVEVGLPDGDGAAGWDPASAQYITVLRTGWETPPLEIGTAYLFDDASAVARPVCAIAITRNVDARYPNGVHPFQPVLWSACSTTTLYRM